MVGMCGAVCERGQVKKFGAQRRKPERADYILRDFALAVVEAKQIIDLFPVVHPIKYNISVVRSSLVESGVETRFRLWDSDT